MVNADGTGRRYLTKSHAGAHDVDPAWSPDGSRLAFGRCAPSNCGIYVLDLKTGRERLLVTNRHVAQGPTWSPDGRKIAFTSLTETPAVRDYSGVYVMDANGRGARRLTPITQWADRPAWSPDGKRIAFVRWLPQHCGRVVAIASLRVMSASGSGQRELARYAISPAWSPDGSELAYTGPRAEICVMRANGTAKHCLTKNDVRDDDPAWSPDGRWLAFDSDRAGRDFYILPATGGAAKRLTRSTRPMEAWSPAWRPPSAR